MFEKVAIAYSDMGYSIIPLSGKKPIMDDWSKYCEQKPSENEIENWCEKYTGSNIGLACGKASGVCALDFDYEGNDREKVENILLQIIPPSPVRKRGKKGWTAFYRYNSAINSTWINRNKQRLVDFLSDGKQTVLPPSMHPESLSPYIWVTEDTLLDVKASDLPLITQDMLDKIKELGEFDFNSKENPFNRIGGRHDVIIAYAWAIIEDCKDIDELTEKLIAYDLRKFNDDPYFLDKKYFKGKNQNQAAMEVAKKIEKHVKRSKKKKDIDWDFSKKQENGNSSIQQAIEMSEGFFIVNEEGNIIPQYNDMANYLENNNVFKSFDTIDYVYNGKHWESLGEVALDNLITKLNKNMIKPHHFIGYKKMIRAICFKKNNIQNEYGLMNLNNCILNVRTGEVLSHTNEMFFTNVIDIDYKKEAKCDLWINFLNDIFNKDQELISLAQDIIGYTLLGGNPFLHKAFVFYGEGRNGKSTFIDVFRMLVGKGASSVGLKFLDKPFSVVNLDGKIANLVEESPTGDLASEYFKAAVGGGILTAAKKGKDEYDLRIQARFIFACNKMPTFDDKNESLLDRLCFLPFTNYIPEEKRDMFLTEKLSKELSGILSWAIVGASRVLNKLKLTDPKICHDLKEEFRADNDNVYSWAIENIKYEQSSTIFYTTRELYKRYEIDVRANNQYPVGFNQFSKRFRKVYKEKLSKNKITPGDTDVLNNGDARGYTRAQYLGSAKPLFF